MPDDMPKPKKDWNFWNHNIKSQSVIINKVSIFKNKIIYRYVNVSKTKADLFSILFWDVLVENLKKNILFDLCDNFHWRKRWEN